MLGVLELAGRGAGFLRRREAGYLPSNGDIHVGERIPVVVVQASAERDPRPGLARLGRELLADVERVLADMRVDVDDHRAIINHLRSIHR